MRNPKRNASETRELIGEMLSEGRSQAEIARVLGLAKATVSYHARLLDVPARVECARRYDWAEVQAAHDAGLGVRACAREFGFSSASWYEAVKRGVIKPRPYKIPIEELLVSDRPETNRTHLKQRLISEGLKRNECEECGITDWRGKPLSMALHHLNGIGTDNRLENLALLCPNCHAQTENFAGKALKRPPMIHLED